MTDDPGLQLILIYLGIIAPCIGIQVLIWIYRRLKGGSGHDVNEEESYEKV